MVPVLTWVASGLLVGWLVRVAMGSRRDFGVLGDLTLGTLGGLTGGWVFRQVGATVPDHPVAHVFVAMTGAAALIGVLRLLRRAMHVTGVSSLPPRGFEADLEHQVRLLNEFERRVLARVLRRRPSAEDPNRVFEAQMTFGQRIADRVATFGGSWTFIGLFVVGLVIWMLVNEQVVRPFDPYPFILLNLVLSCVAALQAPVIMMSQNRQAARDRVDARSDYEVNLRAEMEIMGLHAKLDAVREREWSEFLRLQQEQLAVLQRIEARVLGEGSRDDS
jgi:uncharacterized membrane protein/uncharacterized membrane protein YeaQ/YmgE (transglycosylase-associated protein family)